MNVLILREPVNAWSHAAWLLMALPVGLILWRRGAGDRARQVSLLVFAASLAMCASASTAYHAVRLPERGIATFALIDHIGIVILIAGSYTPIAWNLMRGRWRIGTLVLAWLAAAAIATLQVTFDLPAWLHTALYLAMGWGVVVCFVELARIVPRRELTPIVAGGVCYSVGALFNLAQWPTLWPGVFGAHELFHVFVVAGSLCHFWFMQRVVVTAVREPLALPAVLTRRRFDLRHAWAGPRGARGGPAFPTRPM
jgi:hemolysin III